MEEWQYWSYWVELDLLVPLTFSHLEDHPDSEQGKSVFENTFAPPSTPDNPHTEVGALKVPSPPPLPPEGDGGGLVPLWPGTGGRPPTAPPYLVTPGTSTVWEYNPNPPAGEKEWTTKKDTGSLFHNDPSAPPSALPTDVNRVVTIPDVNNDGVEDVAICTEHGVYIVRSKNGNK